MKLSLSFLLIIAISERCFSQSVHLSDQLNKNQITVVNREISVYEAEGIELNAREGDGLAILSQIEFKSGTIDLEIRGENNPGKSFVGFAFNVQNDSTFEAVYFRPFNFVVQEPIRKSHMAQYIFHPVYTWYKLREERTGEYEGEMQAPPDPDDWFKVKIRIKDHKVNVFVNGEAFMEVDRLTYSTSSKVGLWVGNGSSGRFKNLVILDSE
ncbi:MAG: family 16 glycoside hydrolase [Bacteroidota bacterium]